MLIITIFLIALFTGIGAFITGTGPFLEETTKRITNRGKWFLLLTGVLIFLPVMQYWMQQKADAIKDNYTKIQQDRRDSILRARYDSALVVMKNKFDTSDLKSTAIISETLGKYGYKLDSSTRSLKKIISDSSKTKVIISDDPVLGVTDMPGIKAIDLYKYENNRYYYYLYFRSSDAGSSHFEVLYSLILSDSIKGDVYLKKDTAISYESALEKNSMLRTQFTVTDNFKYDYLYIWIRGNYKNLDGSKTFMMDYVYFHTRHNNDWGYFKGHSRDRVIETIKKYEK
jgi:hypothetical protein